MTISPVTLALTHFNRFDLLVEAVHSVMHDGRIREIVISDDASTDGSWEKIKATFGKQPKVRLFRNPTNLDCYRNKAEAVKHSSSPWVILFDSDNVIDSRYLDRLFALPGWDPGTIYCPDFAEPTFDYTQWAGMVVDKDNVASLMGPPREVIPSKLPLVKIPRCRYCGEGTNTTRRSCPSSPSRTHRWVLANPVPHYRPQRGGIQFGTVLNTANYFLYRDSWLSVWDGSIDPHTADTLFQAYNWLKSGKRMMVVPGLRYFHRMHEGSHYKQNRHKTGSLATEIENKLREFKNTAMKPMVKPLTYGRMGNFLFQAACAMSYAWKHKMDFTLPSTTTNPKHNPIYLGHLINRAYAPTLYPEQLVREKGFTYQEIPFEESWRQRNIVLDGYWQSEKYFKDYREEILQAFGYRWEPLSGFVSVHVRRGDYLTLVNKHPPVPVAWIEEAMRMFPDHHFIFFSDEIEWCKKTFGRRKDVSFSEGRSEEQDLIYMSHCQHQICSASTFSWWGAWLNRNPKKKVVIPRRWFMPGRPEDTRDIVPPEWIRL